MLLARANVKSGTHRGAAIVIHPSTEDRKSGCEIAMCSRQDSTNESSNNPAELET